MKDSFSMDPGSDGGLVSVAPATPPGPVVGPGSSQTGVGPGAGDPCSRRCLTFTLGRWACPAHPVHSEAKGRLVLRYGACTWLGGAAGVGRVAGLM